MLSRTADCIYWMSRQTERAENMARLLDVVYQLSLMPRALTPAQLRAPLAMTGIDDGAVAGSAPLTAEHVIHAFTLDPNNLSSIYACLRQARENAHVVRGKITADMWETLNATWLEMRQLNRDGLRRLGYSRFFGWVKERSHLFRGVTFGTSMRNDAFHFSRLGTFLERADNTARILLAQQDGLLPPSRNDGAHDYYQWGAVLRSLSAFESYRDSYRDSLRADHVAELLILREDFPRSLHACVSEIGQVLELIEGNSGIYAQRKVAEIRARLRYSRIDDILAQGLEPFIDRFLDDIAHLGEHIHRAYLEAA